MFVLILCPNKDKYKAFSFVFIINTFGGSLYKAVLYV